MNDHLKQFTNHSAYSAVESQLIKPNVSYCVQENEVHYNPFSYANEYLTFAALESGTFTFTPQNSNVISYSIDNGETWTEGNSVQVSNGDKVMWKGIMTPIEYKGIGKFSSTGNFDVQGNAMSLLFGDNFKGQTDLTGKDFAFYGLFQNNKKMISAENLLLPATTLANCCYTDMFISCANLVMTPELPATTLANSCYQEMFYGCTSLTTVPELPATILADACYISMFRDCKGLTTAPKLPAKTLASYCYSEMFYNCTSLTTAPELPATTLASYCYKSMFQDCTRLVTAPSVLPATTLTSRCYQYMFEGCASLTTAPELPATTLVSYCYYEMFNACRKLNYIKAMFTTTPSGSSPNYYTSNWVSGVASTGTFVKNSAATWNVTGANGVPTGWTVETESV